MNVISIALIEDEIPKRDSIHSFINDFLPDANILEARAVKSARALIRARKVDLLLLDMSLPTFEITESDPGGRPQGLGGVELMMYMIKDGCESPVIVVTGYQEFSEKSRYMSLESLKKELSLEFPSIFKGLVSFNVLSDEWKIHLNELIKGVFFND